ncbi:Thermophilic serine proteinase [Fusarium oxysporum f. sp. cubense race 1]|uniref:Thermophilic serine proteinase n=1 Tax=Fusarium oxysporum f. sp. cubense (strain race 1) TaxID=1229664 RepID=N4UHN9_FUSC1|nr:Thermophilic serine proteinase [Fusarium oxysporum f. sp. cubense race 1]
MKSYNLLKVLLVAASVAVDAEEINKPAVRSSRNGRTSTGNTRKFIVEVEPMEGVVNVWQAHKVAMPKVENSESGPSSSIRNYSIHHWTGVDKLHAAGIRGKGSTVAIIDTGIDYTHKALGGCFGPGCKVKGGYDLVGADWETHNERKHPKQPDNDPMDYQGHGTHVAGIIAAKNEWLTGVAPEAELLIYKVFSDLRIARIHGRLTKRPLCKHCVMLTMRETGEDLGPLPVYFTTWGPTNELLLKPDITAPGYMIMSTVLNQSYEELSGTSMSAPYIAGIAALFVGQYGGRAFNGAGFAKMLRDRIASSGTTLPFVNNRLMRKYKASPFQVGTGLVDAWKVLNYDTQLEYEPFSLMDTELFRPRWSFNITNTGGIAHEYTFKLEPQAGFNIYDPEYGVALLYAIEPKNIVPPVRLPHRVLIEPGETRELSVTFGLPDFDDDYLPLYSGKVLINSDHGEKLAIPYGGAAYDTEKAFDNMFIVDPFVTDPDKDSAWSFNIDIDASDFIEIGGRTSYACDNLRWDIFEQGWSESLWTYPPRVGRHGFIGSATTMRDAEEFWFFDPTANDPNDTLTFPLKQQSRGFHVFWWFGKLANGTRIAPGNYTMRFAALRPYGNPNISDHWDVMNSPTASSIQVLPYNGTRNSTLKYRAPKYQTPSLGKGLLKG